MAKLKIDKLVFGGQGLGRIDNKVCFSWNALPEEEVEFNITKNNKKFSEGTAIKIYKPSPQRIDPKEEHFLICSPLQILNWEEENRWKVEMAKENYQKIADITITDLDIVYNNEPYHYRNKIEYSFAENNGKISFAFFERGSKKHIPILNCALSEKEINISAREILDWLNKVKPPVKILKSLILRSNGSGQTIVALFIKEKINFKYYPKLNDHLIGFHIYYSNPLCPASIPTEIIHTSGDNYLIVDLNGFKLKFGLLSFFQINIPIFKSALQDIANFIKTGENIIDYYGGVGAISIPLANKCQSSIIVENNKEAVDYAKENIILNKLKNYTAELIPAEKLCNLINKDKVLIFDPPRDGLHPKIIKRVLETQPRKIIYLSCNLSTQARDLKLLKDTYKISFIKLYNFFPRTPHIESLCVLESK